MDRVFSSPEALIEATQSLSARQRALMMDMIRSNPKICGYSLTMATDITYRGEGSIEGWANYKKDMTDALSDGWEDLRWCINFDRPHIYSHEPLRFILDLSNIGVLRDRDYPATVRIRGAQGTVWRKDVVIRPVFDENGESAYVIPVLDETLSLRLPAGRYTVSAAMTGGAHPTCGERTFYVTDRRTCPTCAARSSIRRAWRRTPCGCWRSRGPRYGRLTPKISRTAPPSLWVKRSARRRLTASLPARGAVRTSWALRAPPSARMRRTAA